MLKKGYIKFLNFTKILFKVRHIISSGKLPKSTTGNNSPSQYGQLTGSFTIRNGLLSNQNLTLQADQLEALGKGIVNLAQDRINYLLTLQYTLDKKTATVPVTIYGRLTKPATLLIFPAYYLIP